MEEAQKTSKAANPERKKNNPARLYVGAYLILNIILVTIMLVIVLSVGSQLFHPPSRTYAFGMEVFVYLFMLVATLLPIVSIPVSMYYLSQATWAKKALLLILGTLLICSTILCGHLFFYGQLYEITFLVAWLVAAALLVPGIVLIYRQEIVSTVKTTVEAPDEI
jgi:hypothetical protein